MPSLDSILQQRSLFALFQPIVDFSNGDIFGFEGLIRAPADSPLHTPANLFHAARQQGRTVEVEMLCRQVVLESFARQNLPGKIFLNVSPHTLKDPSFRDGQTLAYLRDLNIDPARVIIEITEDQPAYDFEEMRHALLHYRAMGFQIAIDDLGEGFASLRLWSELRPEFVKVDMHFVQRANQDPVKQQFLRAIQQIARSAGSQIIAERIETDAEFRVVRDIGIAYGQGYFIGRPDSLPPLTASHEVGTLLHSVQQSEQTFGRRKQVTVGMLMRQVEPFHPDTAIHRVLKGFAEHPTMRAIPVVRDGVPVGLINRYEFVDSFAQPFRRELLGRKPCHTMMNAKPLLVEQSTPIHELSSFLIEYGIEHFIDGFIITDCGQYIGLGTGQDLLREMTRAQIETARYANPLTLLPGNVPTNEHIENLLTMGKSFAVCYADLDHFKPYNDVYGYRKGDEVIQYTGRILAQACATGQDFIGHIGGDDFIMVMQSPDWEARCQQALQAYNNEVHRLFDAEHVVQSGFYSEDRQGRVIKHPLTSLSIGAICVMPECFHSHHEIAEAATAAKKMAKRTAGNSLFIERRATALFS